MRSVFLGLLLVSPCLPAFADDAAKPASGPEPTSVVVSVKAGDSWGYEFRDGITNDLISTVQVTVTQVAEGDVAADEEHQTIRFAVDVREHPPRRHKADRHGGLRSPQSEALRLTGVPRELRSRRP